MIKTLTPSRAAAFSFPAGWSAFLIVLLGFGASHAGMKAIYAANLHLPALITFFVLGTALVLVTRHSRPSVQAGLGALAGLLFWAASGEIWGGGELYELAPAIWGVVLVTTLFLALRPGTRCDFFVLIQKALRVYRPIPPEQHWHAPAVAFEFFYTVWIAHMFELTAYYHPAFGVHSWLTSGILIGSFASAPFLLYLLYRTRDWTTAWGRAIPIVLIVWMGIEVLIKWGMLPRP